jgi:protein TonB
VSYPVDSRSRKALSWSVSVVVHAVLAFFIGRAALNYALPEGEVNSDPTTFDVVSGPNGEQADFKTIEPKKNMAAPQPKVSQSKPTQKVHVFKGAQAPSTDDHVTFLPDKDFNQIKAAPPEDDTQDLSKDDVAKDVVPEAVPEHAVNEDEGVEKTENVPQTLPKKEKVAQSEAPPVTDEPPSQEAASAQSVDSATVTAPDGQGTQSQSGGGSGTGETPPAYGTPGTSIDIAKLMEKSGNPKPYYPFSARFRHQEGLVILRAYIETTGKVDTPTVEKSSGFATLDAEAVKAFSRWRYEANQGGWALKPFQFNIKK